MYSGSLVIGLTKKKQTDK